MSNSDQVPAAAAQLRMLALFDSVNLGPAALPAGYRLIEASRAKRPQWVELLDLSGEFGIVDMRMLKREILSILIPDGAVLIGFGDEVVACAAACYAPRFAPYALMNYVLVKSDHRGKALGRIASLEAMRRAKMRGFPGMVLQTDDSRDSAIAMYLKLGFQPVEDSSSDAPARWKVVMERLG